MNLWRRNENDPHKQIARLSAEGIRLYKHGQYEDAVKIFTQLCSLIKQIFGENHQSYATSLNTLGSVYFEIGDYSKAEPLFQKALEIRREVLGENHPYYAGGLIEPGIIVS